MIENVTTAATMTTSEARPDPPSMGRLVGPRNSRSRTTTTATGPRCTAAAFAVSRPNKALIAEPKPSTTVAFRIERIESDKSPVEEHWCNGRDARDAQRAMRGAVGRPSAPRRRDRRRAAPPGPHARRDALLRRLAQESTAPPTWRSRWPRCPALLIGLDRHQHGCEFNSPLLSYASPLALHALLDEPERPPLRHRPPLHRAGGRSAALASRLAPP